MRDEQEPDADHGDGEAREDSEHECGHVLGVTQPVLYSAFPAARRRIVTAAEPSAAARSRAARAIRSRLTFAARMRAYLGFAAAHPRVYEAMFALPSELSFAAADTPEPLRRALAGIRDVCPDADDTYAEVAWATLHGLASLQAVRRLTPGDGPAQGRLDLARRILSS